MDTRDAEEPFQALLKGLLEAHLMFLSGAEAERGGVIHALSTITKYFESFPQIGPFSLNLPLIVLLDALMALESGQTKPLLKAKPRSGRAPASKLDESLMGLTAFTVRRLQKLGDSKNDAMQTVANVISNAGAKKSRGSLKNVSARTVRTWCERVDADVARKEQAAQTFDEFELQDSHKLQTSKSDARKFYLDGLRTMVNALHHGEEKAT